MNTIKLKTQCENCGEEIQVSCAIDPTTCANDVKAGIRPNATAYIYNITSDQIGAFIQAKAKQFVPDINVVIQPQITKKSKNPYMDKKRYAYIGVAFSDNALDNKDSSWYEKIGDSGIRLVPDIFKFLVDKYRYDKKTVEGWLKDYRYMEYLETVFNINSAFLEDIKSKCIPTLAKAADNKNWILFAASPEKIIQDMLTMVQGSSPEGRLEIVDIQEISKGNIAYTVYIYPNEVNVAENAHVRSLLMGDKK